jgi:hypothetical protein
VYAQVKGFRSDEQSTMCCVGDRLYYRSNAIAPAVMLVLSTQYLTEIGQIYSNGQGPNMPTVDISHLHLEVVRLPPPPPPLPFVLASLLPPPLFFTFSLTVSLLLCAAVGGMAV